MFVRNSLWAALVAAAVLTACGSTRNDGEDGGADAGEDAGNDPCANVPADGGSVSLEELYSLPTCGQYITLANVVVHTVIEVEDGGNGSAAASFYVGLSDGGTGPGVFVEKFFTDLPREYAPAVGDRINVRGLLSHGNDSRNPARHDRHREGYRYELRNSSFVTGPNSGPLYIFPRASNATLPTPAIVDETFSSDGGTVAAHPELLGSLVHLPGPVEITNPNPDYMLRYNRDDGAALYLAPNRDNYEGIEVNGITVFDNFLPDECDELRDVARDAGTGKVVFPDGITGVWEAYTMVPFCSPFPDCLEPGFIPAPDGGRLGTHINAIWVFNCATHFDGGYVP